MILVDVFFRIQKQKIKNCTARPPFKAGRPVPRRKFQPVNLVVSGTSPGQEKERGCGHPVY